MADRSVLSRFSKKFVFDKFWCDRGSHHGAKNYKICWKVAFPGLKWRSKFQNRFCPRKIRRRAHVTYIKTWLVQTVCPPFLVHHRQWNSANMRTWTKLPMLNHFFRFTHRNFGSTTSVAGLRSNVEFYKCLVEKVPRRVILYAPRVNDS